MKYRIQVRPSGRAIYLVVFLFYRERTKIMGKDKTRVEKAMDIALERMDYIIDHRAAPDFVEVTGRMGGDTITYRIYNDGSVYER